MLWETVTMTSVLRMTRVVYPLTGICELCEQSFMSRNEDLEQADKEIMTAFNAHLMPTRTAVI
jgi:hypothetical protein